LKYSQSGKENKFKQSEIKDVNKYLEEKELESAKEKIYLKHRVNAHVEYRWNGIYRDFQAYERKVFNKTILTSKDFIKSSKYFTVEEIKKEVKTNG